MNKLLLTLLCLSLFSLVSQSQRLGPHVSFHELEHSFDTIHEEDGRVRHTFRFDNMGNAPLAITNVRSSCGCTTPKWTRDDIPPWGSGFVEVEFSPAGRSGNFRKTILVHTNDEQQSPVKLFIAGYVVGRPLTLEEKFPRLMEEIGLRSNHLSFGKVYKGKKKESVLEYVNLSDTSVVIDFLDVPEHVSLTTEKKILEPGERDFIRGTFDPDKINDWGFVIARISVVVNGKVSAKTRMTLSADINEDFVAWSEKERRNAPKMRIAERSIDLGDLEQNQEVPFSFLITNEGNSDLRIRKVSTSCGCTVTQANADRIPPGGSLTLEGTFETESRTGIQHMVITLITNDPDQPTQRVFLNSVVKK